MNMKCKWKMSKYVMKIKESYSFQKKNAKDGIFKLLINQPFLKSFPILNKDII